MENRIAFSLTEAEQTQLTQHLNAILQIIVPKSIVLSAEERHDMPKMADGNLPFTEKAIAYMASAPQFKPYFIDTADAEIDLAGYKLIKPLLTSTLQIAKAVEDIFMLSGSEAYMAALAYYKNVKFCANAKQPGAKEIYDDLSKRFVGGNKPKKP
ncbi:hypothetical protein [Arcicella rigui]|uniref:Uncharacterized protein n=1 Tax=Arcicella rigui TaxID=797020 RepID=A0ABU5Q7N5_9BACT|nr:hypothetical protein [Arcicella rigui]MEA5138839.1 hypothetical protein [Arcicella rigui]